MPLQREQLRVVGFLEKTRARVAEVEERAALIRRRLFRATLEATVAECEEAKVSAPDAGGRASSVPATAIPVCCSEVERRSQAQRLWI